MRFRYVFTYIHIEYNELLSSFTSGSDPPIILIGFPHFLKFYQIGTHFLKFANVLANPFFAIDFDVGSLVGGVWRSETLLEYIYSS